jgi:hypothetical protein
VKMYKDKEVKKNFKNIVLSMCDVQIFLTFTSPNIVNTICRRSWYIASNVRKIYDFKIEVIPFIINFSTELTTVVKFQATGPGLLKDSPYSIS